MQDISPDLIKLDRSDSSLWYLDSSSTTDERVVLYYTQILPVDGTTVPVLDRIMVDIDSNAMKPSVTTETWTENNVIHTRRVYSYEYNGATFYLEAEVDAVQTHNAEAAILSAWGKKVSVSGSGSLSFAN